MWETVRTYQQLKAFSAANGTVQDGPGPTCATLLRVGESCFPNVGRSRVRAWASFMLGLCDSTDSEAFLFGNLPDRIGE
jgi:hypothetical protein